MGIYLRINGYKKEQSCIVGHISSLGYYEVKVDAIEAFKIRETGLRHDGCLHMIEEIKDYLNEFEISDSPLYFYELVSHHSTGQSLGKHEGETTCLMFEPSNLLYPIAKIVEKKNSILSLLEDESPLLLKETIEKKEPEFLEAFKTLIEEAIEQNAMIGILFS